MVGYYTVMRINTAHQKLEVKEENPELVGEAKWKLTTGSSPSTDADTAESLSLRTKELTSCCLS